jgi:dihydropyrimidinase
MSGSAVYFVHLSSPQSVDLVAEARARGITAYAETCPHYLGCDDSVYSSPRAARYLMTPPLRDRTAQAGLWDALAAGRIDAVGSDHCGFALPPREAENDFTRISPGVPGVETTLHILHTLGVAQGRIDVSSMVRLLTYNPARIFGLPSKGDIRPGLDADLVLFDPQAEWILEDGDLHGRAGFSPYSGMRLRGRVMTTVCRGQIVYQDGAIVGQPGFGRFIARRPHRPMEET